MAKKARARLSGFFVKRVLGINVHERWSTLPSDLDARARETIAPAETFIEEEPAISELFRELRPTKQDAVDYIQGLFPAAIWIRRYNLRWLLGDLIAGITIGLVVVPQAMAYAVLAQLPPAYGLYTSFTGAVLYWFFGTSKDIVIGTTAVGSLLIGQVVNHINQVAPGEFSNVQTAHTVSMLCGAVLLFFGLLRLGWIIEFIPYIPISAFVTGAAITILSTQIPTALGVPDVDTTMPPYRVFHDTFKNLHRAKLDAAIGISTVVLLALIKGFCARMEARQPKHKRTWSFISSLRLTFAMLLFTLVSFLVNQGLSKPEAAFRIVGTIQPGFQGANLPTLNLRLAKLVLPELPAIAIILVIEHVAIAKAMGRQYGYTIVPSQEAVALGAANIFSPFVGGYVCTGSFGASAVLSKAGVRTPLAGLFSALVLVLALYALTKVFYYIPNAALAGLIIHAVYGLIAPPKKLCRYWQVSPLELIIWVIGVALAVFVDLETAIYTGIGLSMLLLLIRLARTRGRFLGVVHAKRVDGEMRKDLGTSSKFSSTTKRPQDACEIYLPLDRKDASNYDVSVQAPYPGVFIYRFSENFNYTNQAYHAETLMRHILDSTRRTSEEHFEKESDRPWNDPGSRTHNQDEKLPCLRAVILDCAAVNSVDITCVQGLVDLRNALDRHAAPDAVEWHFANINNRWSRRALAVVGFGFPTSKNPEALGCWRPLYSIAPVCDESLNSTPGMETEVDDEEQMRSYHSPDVSAETASVDTVVPSIEAGPRRVTRPQMATVYPVDRPFFHGDLHDAVEVAVRDARAKDEKAGL